MLVVKEGETAPLSMSLATKLLLDSSSCQTSWKTTDRSTRRKVKGHSVWYCANKQTVHWLSLIISFSSYHGRWPDQLVTSEGKLALEASSKRQAMWSILQKRGTSVCFSSLNFEAHFLSWTINNMNSLRKLVLIPATATHRQAFRCLSSTGKRLIFHKQTIQIPFLLQFTSTSKQRQKALTTTLAWSPWTDPKLSMLSVMDWWRRWSVHCKLLTRMTKLLPLSLPAQRKRLQVRKVTLGK